MCRLADFVINYVLIIGNIIFSLAGVLLISLGTFAHIQLTKLVDVVPVSLDPVTITIIVLGVIIFSISFLACCGALRESICMLISYAVCMAILASIKVYLTVILFRFLKSVHAYVESWLLNTFHNIEIREAFHAMETLFKCCGTVGPNAYGNSTLPATCCADPVNNQCDSSQAYTGCNDIVASWFESFGGAIANVLIIIIIIELVCMLFGLYMTVTIRNNRRRQMV